MKRRRVRSRYIKHVFMHHSSTVSQNETSRCDCFEYLLNLSQLYFLSQSDLVERGFHFARIHHRLSNSRQESTNADLNTLRVDCSDQSLNLLREKLSSVSFDYCLKGLRRQGSIAKNIVVS